MRASSMPLAPDLLDLLACPVCGGTLSEQPEELRCDGCGRRYPLIDGIPQLLPDQSRE
jgi:uncharacterized protein YbaR (Trm112 family)